MLARAVHLLFSHQWCFNTYRPPFQDLGVGAAHFEHTANFPDPSVCEQTSNGTWASAHTNAQHGSYGVGQPAVLSNLPVHVNVERDVGLGALVIVGGIVGVVVGMVVAISVEVDVAVAVGVGH